MLFRSRWGERTTPLGTTDIDLPPATRSALDTVLRYRAAKGAVPA